MMSKINAENPLYIFQDLDPERNKSNRWITKSEPIAYLSPFSLDQPMVILFYGIGPEWGTEESEQSFA